MLLLEAAVYQLLARLTSVIYTSIHWAVVALPKITQTIQPHPGEQIYYRF